MDDRCEMKLSLDIESKCIEKYEKQNLVEMISNNLEWLDLDSRRSFIYEPASNQRREFLIQAELLWASLNYCEEDRI